MNLIFLSTYEADTTQRHLALIEVSGLSATGLHMRLIVTVILLFY